MSPEESDRHSDVRQLVLWGQVPKTRVVAPKVAAPNALEVVKGRARRDGRRLVGKDNRKLRLQLKTQFQSLSVVRFTLAMLLLALAYVVCLGGVVARQDRHDVFAQAVLPQLLRAKLGRKLIDELRYQFGQQNPVADRVQENL